MQVTIEDWGDAEYLDGAVAQYSVKDQNGITVAFCTTLEAARLLANAMTAANFDIVVIEDKNWRRS